VSGSPGAEKQVRYERVEELFRAHAPAVLRYVKRRGVQVTDAEDVVAETFLICFRRISDVPEDALPWLLGVARRTIAHHFRAQRRQRALEKRLVRSAAEVRRLGVSSSGTVDGPAFDAFGRLRASDRGVLRLVVLDGLTPTEAASMLGLTRKAVYGRLSRARANLRALLADAPVSAFDGSWRMGQSGVVPGIE
jgi:RNA polymerase sigma-70 factor (ECF subfamily)